MILNERNYSNIRIIAKEVKSIFFSLKSKILRETETIGIIELFNSKLHHFGIDFQFSERTFGFGYNSDYSEVGIHYASIDNNGGIHIYVLEDLYDILDEYNYSEFCGIIHSILIHELTHLQQIEKAQQYFESPNIDSEIKYLERIQEIQAHANQAVDKMVDRGYSIEDIKTILRSPKIGKIVPQEIDAFYKYYDIFYGEWGDKKVWNKFLKYCYQYLSELENEI